MEDFIVKFAHAAAWFFGFIFLFAVIGFVATIRWIFGLIFKGERAVESGVQDAERFVSRK